MPIGGRFVQQAGQIQTQARVTPVVVQADPALLFPGSQAFAERRALGRLGAVVQLEACAVTL